MSIAEPLQVFVANQNSILITLAISGCVALISLFAIVYLRKKEVALTFRAHRQLGIMLLGLALIIALGSTVGSIVNLKRLRPIYVYEDSFTTGFGTVKFQDLRFVYLHQGRQPSFVSPSITVDTTLLAYFEEKQGKSYVLSSDNYDVRAIVDYIRPKVDSLKFK